MKAKIKVGDPIQGFGGFTHSNGDMLHTDVDEIIENLNKGCYVGDVDLAPDYDPELEDVDLQETLQEEQL